MTSLVSDRIYMVIASKIKSIWKSNLQIEKQKYRQNNFAK